jgi:hypothetical protein
MRHPATSAKESFAISATGIVNIGLKNRILEIEPAITAAETRYSTAGYAKSLYLIPPNNRRNEEFLVGQVTKGELKDMYSYYLVDKSKPGRSVYDVLLASAPNGICPLCGVGYAATLDHFLPKSKFPLFSILPSNLVPACRDCNTGKLTAHATTYGEQSLHPYFDHGIYVDDQWLFAKVMHTSPASISFYVSPPSNWTGGDKERVESHFTSFKLSERYAILAAGELASINSILRSYIYSSGPSAIQDYLNACAISEFNLYKNSWKTAMLLALAADDWFCYTGFLLV